MSRRDKFRMFLAININNVNVTGDTYLVLPCTKYGKVKKIGYLHNGWAIALVFSACASTDTITAISASNKHVFTPIFLVRVRRDSTSGNACSFSDLGLPFYRKPRES